MKNILNPATKSYQDGIISSMNYMHSTSPVVYIVIRKAYMAVLESQRISTYLILNHLNK